MRSGQTVEGIDKMAVVITLPQTSKWAKRKIPPPIRQRNQASRTREYLTPGEVERMVVAARRAGGRLAERLVDHDGLPARSPRVGTNRVAMGTDRFEGGLAVR